MKATELRKKHYEFWVEMESATREDLKDDDIPKKVKGRIAYNAAFNATYLHHKALIKVKADAGKCMVKGCNKGAVLFGSKGKFCLEHM